MPDETQDAPFSTEEFMVYDEPSGAEPEHTTPPPATTSKPKGSSVALSAEPEDTTPPPDDGPTEPETTTTRKPFFMGSIGLGRLIQKRVMEANGGPPNPAPTRPPRCPITNRLIGTKAVKSALKAARAAGAKLDEVSRELRPMLDPRSYRQDIIERIERAKDADEIARLRDEHAKFSGDAAEAARRAAITIQRRFSREFGRNLIALADAAESELNKIADQVRKAEAELYKGFGLGHEPTGLTRRVGAIRNEIRRHRSALITSAANHQFMCNSGSSAMLELFAE